MKRRVILLALTLCLLMTIPSFVYAYYIVSGNCWYSNTDEIGKWSFTPTISSIKLNSNSSFYFEDGYSRARSQWGNAGITTTNNGTSTSSNIVCYGGTVNQIYSTTGYQVPSNVCGITNCSATLTNTRLEYDGLTYKIYNISHANVYILDLGNNLNKTKMTCIHEVGHSLGWFGHSTLSSDIMYSYSTENITLTTRDKNHLVQVY